MLAAVNRMRRSGDFTLVLRGGKRARRGSVVVCYRQRLRDGAPIVGLIVGKSVGGSVIRHRVSRRLRAQIAARLDRLGPGSATVVRALPAAATASSAELARDLDAALGKLGIRS